MLKKAAGFLLVCVLTAPWMGCSNTVSHFVYAALPSSDQIGIYREDPQSGVLTQLADSPFAAGNAAESVVVAPGNKFMFVANAADNTVASYSIESNGEISPGPITNAGTTPSILAIDSAGAFLYEGDSGSNSITVYSVSSGTLTQVSTFGIGMQPLNLKLNSAGNVLYVVGPGQPNGFIQAFAMSGGKLQSVVGIFSSGGASPHGLTIDPAGTHLYVANGAPDNSIGEFNIGTNGTLTAIAGSPLSQSNGINPLSVIIEPSGTYMYVSDEGSNNISAYTIASDGSISPLATPNFTTGTQPGFLAMDPNGRYLLVGIQSGSIEVFSLSSGNLDVVMTLTTASNPTSLAITQ